MSAIIIPFSCIIIGAIINWKGLPANVLKIFDWIMNIALVCLMMVIGLNIGTSETVMNNLGRIGLNSVIISLTAIGLSVILTLIFEKTVLPLSSLHEEIKGESPVIDVDTSKSSISPLIVIMPGAIIIGILLGYFVLTDISEDFLGRALDISLVLLYISVGVSMASNKAVFGYVKKLGLRILFIPLAVFVGCILGGAVSGLILGVPLDIATISASGMGYYSLTGAYLTETMSIEAGTYGFIVNVSRDVLTVMLMPILSRLSKGSPIASGAGGCMDTMLIPVTKAIGIELSVIAFLAGTIITLMVPVTLPVLTAIFA